MTELQRQQIDSFAAQPAISQSSQIKLGLHAPKANQFLRGQTQSKLSQLYSRCISTVPHCHIACQQIVLPKLQAECPFSGTGTKTTHGELYVASFKKNTHTKETTSASPQKSTSTVSAIGGGCPTVCGEVAQASLRKNSGKIFDSTRPKPQHTAWRRETPPQPRPRSTSRNSDR